MFWGVYDEAMDIEINLTPEIKALIRRHLGHGCAASPEAVLLRALEALQGHETMQSPPDYREKDVEHVPAAEPPSGAVSRPASDEEVLRHLAAQGAVRWNGGKPQGLRGARVRGTPVSDTVLDARR
jgi:hypothetical protein